MIGTRFFKNDFDYESYSRAAEWCNENQNAKIEDKGDYYEVVEIVAPLNELKGFKIKELKSIRDRKELESILYDGDPFDFDEKSYNRITAAIFTLEKTGDPTATIAWTTADNNTKQMTANDLRNVIAQAGFRSNLLHIRYRELKEQVLASRSEEELNNIVWGD